MVAITGDYGRRAISGALRLEVRDSIHGDGNLLVHRGGKRRDRLASERLDDLLNGLGYKKLLARDEINHGACHGSPFGCLADPTPLDHSSWLSSQISRQSFVAGKAQQLSALHFPGHPEKPPDICVRAEAGSRVLRMAVMHLSTPTPEPVTEEQGFALLDKQAQARLGISGAEFLRRWDAGDYDAPDCDRPEVVKVAMLMPLAR